ncbi:transposase [Gymnodinialimonas ulvae]|uniref:transposase n=1 Tax=Gymnodinialimonas ulvae TaxID=3126504 RepID=UPI0030B71608
MRRHFFNQTDERVHWLTLFLGLPAEGIATHFPTEAACEARIAEVRWPNGPICTSCSGKNIAHPTTRKPFRCRNCNKQFSVTSGTFLHGRRLSLEKYFQLAAEIIDRETRGSSPTGHGIKDTYGIAYATAVRLKKAITDELSSEDGGLLGRCICVCELAIPQDVELGSVDHLQWLQGELERRRWQSLGFE